MFDRVIAMSTHPHMSSSHCTAKSIAGLVVAVLAWTVFVVAIWALQSPVIAVVAGLVLVQAVVVFLKYGNRVDKRRK